MITAINTTTGNKATTATSNNGAVSAQEQSDRFMKLLVAQLNNQDPMNPMDNAQMTSQIAQINTVSGIQELNATMKGMAEQMQVLQGSSMIGRNVMVESGTLSIDGGVAKGAVNLAGKADKVTIDIKTAGGKLLESVNLGPLPAGQTNFQWDASKYSGLTNVTFKVTATQGKETVKSTSLAQDTITAVGTDNGAMSLQLKGRSAVAYSAVKSIL